MCVCVCVSHCVSSVSPPGSQLVADMPHVAGVIGAPSYLPPGERCYQCEESEGFDRVGAGVPLVRRAQRRRRDTHRLASNTTTLPVCISHPLCLPGQLKSE